MPGGMTPHTGQPTPMPNPGGAPMSGGPPLPPQQQQQPGKPPYQQVYIIHSTRYLKGYNKKMKDRLIYIPNKQNLSTPSLFLHDILLLTS